MVEQYGNTVKVVFKNFPLRNHAQALPAARAALAAQAQGKFWPYHDKLFAAASRLGEPLYAEIARELGLDLERFEKERNGRTSYDQVVADLRAGQLAEVRGTPAIYVNGLLLEERSTEALKALIDAELARSRTR